MFLDSVSWALQRIFSVVIGFWDMSSTPYMPIELWPLLLCFQLHGLEYCAWLTIECRWLNCRLQICECTYNFLHYSCLYLLIITHYSMRNEQAYWWQFLSCWGRVENKLNTYPMCMYAKLFNYSAAFNLWDSWIFHNGCYWDWWLMCLMATWYHWVA